MLDRLEEAAAEPAPKPKLGKRISWAEFYRQRPDLRPAAANDNRPIVMGDVTAAVDIQLRA